MSFKLLPRRVVSGKFVEQVKPREEGSNLTPTVYFKVTEDSLSSKKTLYIIPAVLSLTHQRLVCQMRQYDESWRRY